MNNDFSVTASNKLRLSKKCKSDLTWNVSSSDLSQLTECNVRTYKKQAEINAANHKVINQYQPPTRHADKPVPVPTLGNGLTKAFKSGM